MASSFIFSFEKLKVWELAIAFAELIYEVTDAFPNTEKYGLVSQMTRAAVSVSSNLAEGTARVGFKDQARFTTIAYSSLMEVMSQSILSNRRGLISKEDLEKIRQDVIALAVKLNNLRKYQLNQSEKKGGQPYTNLNTVEEDLALYFQANSTPEGQLNDAIASVQHLKDKLNYFTHPTAIIDNNTQIGTNTKIWHFSHIMSNATIGENCNIGQNVVVSPDVVLGNNVKVQNNVSIYTGVICEDDVFLGPSMVFTNVINPRSAVNRKSEYLRTVVKKGATIGANATIVCGHNIGRYAFIGAGAVVTKEILDYALVVGNPAKQIGWMSEHGHRLVFSENGEAVCEGSGDKYLLKEGKVVKVG